VRPRLLMVGAGLLSIVCLAIAQAGEGPGGGSDEARIAKLVAQLGSDRFLEREQARKEIETIGAPALVALRRAAHTGDLETSRRAADLVRVIEEHQLTASLLAPKKVHLKVKDAPVLQAVDKLARLSGYTLRVDGDRTLLTGKTVTIDTGAVTFWEAVDRLGAVTGLFEKLTVAAVPGDPNIANEVYMDGGGLRIERRPLMMRKTARPIVLPPPPLRMMPLPKQGEAPIEPAANAVPPAPSIMPGYVILAPGTSGTQVTCYAGAARVLLKHARGPAGAKGAPERVYDLVLEASAEPRLLGFTVVGVPTVSRAVDEHGQVLSFAIDPTPATAPPLPDALAAELVDYLGLKPPMVQAVQRGVTIRLQQGTKPARRLKELRGSLSAQVFVPNATLMVLDNVLKAKGKSVDIKGGGRLQLESIEEIQDSQPGATGYRVVYKLEFLPGAASVLRNGRVINVNSGPLGDGSALELLDAKGQRMTAVNGPLYNQENSPDGQPVRTTGTIVFRRNHDQGEPVRLMVTGIDVPTIIVPFRFEDVSLP
jgi:hypothetical protein